MLHIILFLRNIYKLVLRETADLAILKPMHCRLGKTRVCCTIIDRLSVKIRKNYILKDISLHLHCGELTAVVGKNGAGKSTFMKALLGVIPHTGSVTFERGIQSGRQVAKHTRKAKPRFGYVPQSLSLDEGSPVSVEDLVLSCTSKYPVWLPRRKKDREKVIEILKSTSAQSLTKRRVCELSGGELQRVMLALAIHPLPDILLLDEPVSGVDRAGLTSFYSLVSSLRRDYDITIILISHDLDLVAEHADRVVFINKGQAVSGRVEEIYKREDFIEAFGHMTFDKEAVDADAV